MIIGAFACVVLAVAMAGFGATLTAWLAGLPRAYPAKYFPLVTYAYLGAAIAGGVVVGVCLGIV